jgi:hypothetical protein
MMRYSKRLHHLQLVDLLIGSPRQRTRKKTSQYHFIIIIINHHHHHRHTSSNNNNSHLLDYQTALQTRVSSSLIPCSVGLLLAIGNTDDNKSLLVLMTLLLLLEALGRLLVDLMERRINQYV